MTALNNADSSSQDSVVILLVVGEGGGYTILGEVHQGVWRFWLKAGGGDSWLYDEVDEPDSLKSPPEQATPSPKPKIEYKSSIDDALGLLNPSWPRLRRVSVHPSFAKDVMRHVDNYMSISSRNTQRAASKHQVVTIDPSMTPVHRKGVDYREGALVKHLKRPDWGVGTVMADSTRDSVRVRFEDGEERTFGIPLAALVKVNV